MSQDQDDHQHPGDHGDHHGDHQHHGPGSDLSEMQLRVRALESILTEKGYVDPAGVGSLGFSSRVGEHLVAVENTPRLHNMVVCTLCSCYPWDVLGLPPTWYKSAPYRSRAVIDPRGVLADFGVTLPAATEIRVWDSTAETRFMVLPLRPAGTEGWSEQQLVRLVTRDSMIGTGLAKPAGEVAP